MSDPLLGPIVAIGGHGLRMGDDSVARFLVELTGKERPRALYAGRANGDAEANVLRW